MKDISQYGMNGLSRTGTLYGLPYAFGLVLCLVLTGCGGVDEMHWKEQVYLHDGSLIEVDRDATRLSSGFPQSERGAVLTEELRYGPLKVDWKLQRNESPMSFDILSGVPYAVAALSVDKRAFCVGKQPGDYLAAYYRWINGRQEKIARADVPIALMRKNLSGLSHWGYTKDQDPTSLT